MSYDVSRALIVSRKKPHFDLALTDEAFIDLWGLLTYYGLLNHPGVQADLAMARVLAEARTLVNSSELVRIFAILPEPIAGALLDALFVRPMPRSLEEVIEQIKRQRQARGRRGSSRSSTPRTRGPQSQ